MDRIEALLIDWIPRYWAAGKTYLTVAFGCTGGTAPVGCAAAVEMAERLREGGIFAECPASRPRLAAERHDRGTIRARRSAGESGSGLSE